MSFFGELKRRNVIRVAILYFVSSWLLLQVSDTLGPALQLPDWFQSGVAFVVILGFPIAEISYVNHDGGLSYLLEYWDAMPGR